MYPLEEEDVNDGVSTGKLIFSFFTQHLSSEFDQKYCLEEHFVWGHEYSFILYFIECQMELNWVSGSPPDSTIQPGKCAKQYDTAQNKKIKIKKSKP